MKRFFYSFVCAWRGVVESVRRGRNIRVQLAAGLYALLLAIPALQTASQWAVIFLCVGLVLGAEVFNTAVEALCDKVTRARCEEIRFVKDAAAGAVLVCAIAAAAVGAVILFGFGGLGRILGYCRAHIWYPVLLAVLLPPALLFICRKPRG